MSETLEPMSISICLGLFTQRGSGAVVIAVIAVVAVKIALP
jgi:hypothetical protein